MNKLNTELLRYGQYISDSNYETDNGYIRVRIIAYNNELFKHTMMNGELIEIKKV